MRTITSDFESAISDCFLVVGTSGIVTQGEGHYIRIPLTPRELAERTVGHEGKIALVFGREDLGLTQEQLLRCDLLVHIPAHDEYPVLNLSHAVTVLLYEIFAAQGAPSKPNPATEHEKELLFRNFSELLEAIEYPIIPKGEDQRHVQADDGARHTHEVRVLHHHGRAGRGGGAYQTSRTQERQ